MKMTSIDAAKALAAEAASSMVEGGTPLVLLREFAAAQRLASMEEGPRRAAVATWTEQYFLREGVLQSVVGLKRGESMVVRCVVWGGVWGVARGGVWGRGL